MKQVEPCLSFVSELNPMADFEPKTTQGWTLKHCKWTQTHRQLGKWGPELLVCFSALSHPSYFQIPHHLHHDHGIHSQACLRGSQVTIAILSSYKKEGRVCCVYSEVENSNSSQSYFRSDDIQLGLWGGQVMSCDHKAQAKHKQNCSRGQEVNVPTQADTVLRDCNE